MTFDICQHCDGTGERCILSGAKCYECNGKGVLEYDDPDDCEECGGRGGRWDETGVDQWYPCYSCSPKEAPDE